MPTGEEEDRRLLEGVGSGGVEPWQRRLLLRFRLRRKAALRAALARMEAAWQQAHGSSLLAEGPGGPPPIKAAADAVAATVHSARLFLLSGRWQEQDAVTLLICVAAGLFLSRR
jgi:hypothetical protein